MKFDFCGNNEKTSGGNGMFLNKLTSTEKKAFLSLADALTATDGVLSADEIAMMEQYKQEMNLSIDSDSLPTVSESIKVFKDTSNTVKRQVTFELVALACADKDYSVTEHDWLVQIGEHFGIEITYLDKCKNLVEKLLVLYNEIGHLIDE